MAEKVNIKIIDNKYGNSAVTTNENFDFDGKSDNLLNGSKTPNENVAASSTDLTVESNHSEEILRDDDNYQSQIDPKQDDKAEDCAIDISENDERPMNSNYLDFKINDDLIVDHHFMEKETSSSAEVVSVDDCPSSSVPSPSSSSSLVSLSTRETGKAGGEEEVEELKKLCMHLQSVLDQQLKERERMQKRNEELSQQLQSLKDINIIQQQQQHAQSKQSADAADSNSKQSGEILNLRKELEATKLILETHGSKYTKEVALLTSSYTTKIDALTRSYEEINKEKDSMVIRYAQAESKNIELQETCKRAEARMKELIKEREAAISRWNTQKRDNVKFMKLLETKDNEFSSLKKDCDAHREASNSKELHLKFLQQKVRQEQNINKEVRDKVCDMMQQVASERADCECLLNELKALIQANQMLQLTGSLPTLSQIISRVELVVKKKKDDNTSKELWMDIFENLFSLVALINGLMTENISLKDKVKRASQELMLNEEKLLKNKNNFEDQQKEKEFLGLKLKGIQLKCQEMEIELTSLRESHDKTSGLERMNVELEYEMDIQSKRHDECLEYTNKLSGVFVSLQATNVKLKSEIESIISEKENLLSKCQDLEVENKHLIEQRLVGLKDLEDKVANLEKGLENITTEYNLLSIRYNDVEDELKSLRRQSGGRIKDLTKQLQQLSRKLNLQPISDAGEYDSSGSSNFSDNGANYSTEIFVDTVEDGAAKKSNNKKVSFHLDLLLKDKVPRDSGHRVPQNVDNELPWDRSLSIGGDVRDDVANHRPDINHGGTEVDYLTPPPVRVVEVNKQMLIDKIVSLQKMLAKKNERMDFLQELNLRLTQDVSNKAKIIQVYFLREEGGAMSTNQSDRLKLQMSKRGGIMASLFSSHPQDEAMTVDLALEICHKLQSVLEDTLLKNIAFKESIELLGRQVAKLSKENKEIRIKSTS